MRDMRFVVTPILMLYLFSTGCGDSPELRMQQAQIAMANGKPDQALRTITSVLEEKPNDLMALQLKARAQMLVAQLDESKATLDKLLKTHPDNADVRRNLIDWTWFEIRSLLGQSNFSTDEAMQARFDVAISTGQAQAEWLVTHQKAIAESFYYRARYAHFNARRLQTILDAQQSSLAHVNLDGETGASNDNAKNNEKIDRYLDEAVSHLKEAITADPKHFAACEMYTGFLVQRGHWAKLWGFADRMSKIEGLPASTARRLVSAILAMPATKQSKAQRVERGWKIQSAVNETQQVSPDWQLTTARLHLVVSEWAKAKPVIESVLKSRPNDVEAQYLLSQCLYGLEQHVEARAILEKLSLKSSKSSQIQTLYGLVLLQTGEKVLAKEALRRATELNPDDPVAREAFLALMAKEGHFLQAEGDIDEYLKRHPTDPRAIRYKMQFEQAQGRQGAVADLLKKVESLSPLTDEHLAVLIDGYLMLSQYDKVQEFAQRLVKKQPDAIDSHMRLAEALLMQGKDDQVKQMLVRLRKKFPDASGVNEMLGRLYLQRQSFDRAMEVLEKVVEDEPTNNTARVMLAQAMASLSLLDEAVEQVDLALEQDPDDMRAHALAARIHQFTGKMDKASEHLAQIDEGKISEASNPALLAQIKLRKGKIDEAAEICNRAISAGKPDPVLRMLVAGIYIRKGDLELAEKHLLGLVRNQPNNRQAYALLTRFYLEHNNTDKGLIELAALQSLNEPLARLGQATMLRRKDPAAALDRLSPIYEPLIRKRSSMTIRIADAMAVIEASRGDRTAAYAIYEPLIEAGLHAEEARLRQIDLMASAEGKEKTIGHLEALAGQLPPEKRRLRYQIMRRFVALGVTDRALTLLDQWISLQPDQPLLLLWKGNLLAEVGRAAEAIEPYQQAVSIEPENVSLYLRLAQAHVSNFDYSQAESVLREAAEIDKGAKIVSLASLGRIFLSVGLNRKAADVFDELERDGKPRDPRVLYAMGQAYAALGENDLAHQRLSEVPPFAPQYPPAQVLLARIEQRQGQTQQAKERLKKLPRDRQTTMLAIQELLALKLRNRSVEDLVRWSDKALSIEGLPDQVKLRWLRVRVALGARDRDWSAVLDTLEEMSQDDPESLSVKAAQIVVMIQRRQAERARAIYLSAPKLGKSSVGPLLALAVGEQPDSEAKQVALTVFLGAMIRGDLDAARSAVEVLPPQKTLYRSDLLKMVDRPDASSQEMKIACERLCAALVAVDVAGLPRLAEQLSSKVINRVPGLALAHGIRAQALMDQGESVDAAWENAKQALPGSSLVLYLSAVQKSALGDHDGAIDDLKKLQEREPENYHVDYKLSQELHIGDRIEEAIPILEGLYRSSNPYRVVAANDLAYLLAQTDPDRLDEALDIATDAHNLVPAMTPLLDTLGWIEHLRGNNDKAITYLNRAVMGLSNIPEVHYHLGVVYQRLGQDDWARAHLEQASSAESVERPEVGQAKALLNRLDR